MYGKVEENTPFLEFSCNNNSKECKCLSEKELKHYRKDFKKYYCELNSNIVCTILDNVNFYKLILSGNIWITHKIHYSTCIKNEKCVSISNKATQEWISIFLFIYEFNIYDPYSKTHKQRNQLSTKIKIPIQEKNDKNEIEIDTNDFQFIMKFPKTPSHKLILSDTETDDDNNNNFTEPLLTSDQKNQKGVILLSY
jgi:hypothetical protein